ncbi:heme NO binding protein [Dictyocaulus viviparus]|uniref:Heme NO binding protein n=1 Tax=Dictyocaulus viviparus TaxID=29172 RepID=A0A0D8XES1_DICVI|nr:heme NO binding protein [Dictyocaulus viviparus]
MKTTENLKLEIISPYGPPISTGQKYRIDSEVISTNYKFYNSEALQRHMQRDIIIRFHVESCYQDSISRKIAKFEEGTESEVANYYDDEETMRLVNAMSNVIGIPVEEVWEAYGGFLIQFTMETGWDELLRAMASDLEGFLDSLDSLHYFIDHVVYQTKLSGPSFRCEPQIDGTLILHYYSKRSGLYPIVKDKCIVREKNENLDM